MLLSVAKKKIKALSYTRISELTGINDWSEIENITNDIISKLETIDLDSYANVQDIWDSLYKKRYYLKVNNEIHVILYTNYQTITSALLTF